MYPANSIWLVGVPPSAAGPALTERHLDLLRLKWVSAGEILEDFKGYLCLNKSRDKIATGASKRYADSRLEIWSVESRELLLTHQTDSSSSACLSWLADDRYFTGSNDSVIRLWSEAECQAELIGHKDWVRCMHLSQSEESLASGAMDGSVAIWDVPSLRKRCEFVVSPPGSMNSVQGVSFSNSEREIFAVTREGLMCCVDVRSQRGVIPPVSPTQFRCHDRKSNSVQVSESGVRVLTSARDSSARLWDVRQFARPVQVYRQHVCKMFPIQAKFMNCERLVVTGSEDDGACIYDTLSGQMVKKVNIGSAVTQTEPTAHDDLAFFVIAYQHQRLGLVDAIGADAELEKPTAEESLRERMKVAMQESLWQFSNQIYNHLRLIGRYNMIGYGNLLEVLQETAATDSGSRELLREVHRTYEWKLNQPQPAPFSSPAPTQYPDRATTAVTSAPHVVCEKSASSSFPTYFPH